MRIQQKIRVDDDDTHDGRHERKLNDSTTQRQLFVIFQIQFCSREILCYTLYYLYYATLRNSTNSEGI
jgi:hypothetical protein